MQALLYCAALSLSVLISGCELGAAEGGQVSGRGSGTQPATSTDVGGAWTKVGPGATTLAQTLGAEAARAHARSLIPVVYIGAGWCEPCAAMKAQRDHPRMREAFRGVHVVELDFDEWQRADLRAAGLYAEAIPVFHVMDSDGHVLRKALGGWENDTPESMGPWLAAFFAR